MRYHQPTLCAALTLVANLLATGQLQAAHPGCRVPAPALGILDRLDPQTVRELIVEIDREGILNYRRADLLTELGTYKYNNVARQALYYRMNFMYRPEDGVGNRAQSVTEDRHDPRRDSPAATALARMGTVAVPTLVDESLRVIAASQGRDDDVVILLAIIVLTKQQEVAQAGVDRLMKRKAREVKDPAVQKACDLLIRRIVKAYTHDEREKLFPPAALRE